MQAHISIRDDALCLSYSKKAECWQYRYICKAIELNCNSSLLHVVRESGVSVDFHTPIPIKVLILPKFEIGMMAGDEPGEAQFFYEHYLLGGQEYEIPGAFGSNKLFVKGSVALFVTGMGKVNSTISACSLLRDSRFDWSQTYVLSVGCAGGSTGHATMGDVVLASAVVDYDLGHHADIREMTDKNRATWFHDSTFDHAAFRRLNPELVQDAYELVRDIEVATTAYTRSYMDRAFSGAAWATRDPKVLLGTTMSSDNYWKGKFGHDNAELMVSTYGCPDRYAAAEMEDTPLAVLLDRFGMLDRYLVVRAVVNMDVFVHGATPETLWSAQSEGILEFADDEEVADIFPVAMENNFVVGRVIVDALLDGRLGQ